MRHWTIVVGLLAGACFTDPPGGGGSGSTTSTGSDASSSSMETSTETTDGSSSFWLSSSTTFDSSFSSSSASAGCVDGEEGCACMPKQTCDAGLVCREGVCEARRCGNGMPDSGEECDDGNDAPGDGCAADCTEETQCFVGNFGGAPIRLSSFAISRTGEILHRDGETVAGDGDQSENNADETSLVRRRRFVYLANDGMLEPLEIGLDGTFQGTSAAVDIPGLQGLAADRRIPGVLATSQTQTEFALHLVASDPDGSNPSLAGTVPVRLSSVSQSTVIDFHPQFNLAYILVEPNQFTGNIEVITLRFGDSGELGETTVAQLSHVGAVRGMRAVEDPAEVLLTGIYETAEGDGCFGRIELSDLGELSGAGTEVLCGAPWGGYFGIIQPDPAGPVVFGSVGMSIAEWDRATGPANVLATAGSRHFFRLPWPDMLVVASNEALTTVSLDDSGAPMALEDQLALSMHDLAPPLGSNPSFQAGVMIPCPNDR